MRGRLLFLILATKPALMRAVRICLIFILSLFPGFAAFAQDALEPVLQPLPRPMPTTVLTKADLRLELYFSAIKQGGVGLMRMSGDDIDGATAAFLRQNIDFFTVKDGAWYALLYASMDASARVHQLEVQVKHGSDAIIFEREVRIDTARYILQEFDMPDDRLYLVDLEVEAAEFAILREQTMAYSAAPLWDAAGFGLPLDSAVSSPYGAYRVLNDVIETRHTGWDQQAPDGTAVHAMAAGEIVFADMLDIRGNFLLVNHGLGVYSGYAHLAEFSVNVGDAISAGQVIGISGNSGRSSGPHLHWEVIVGGNWIDGLSVVDLWLPS